MHAECTFRYFICFPPEQSLRLSLRWPLEQMGDHHATLEGQDKFCNFSIDNNSVYDTSRLLREGAEASLQSNDHYTTTTNIPNLETLFVCFGHLSHIWAPGYQRLWLKIGTNKTDLMDTFSESKLCFTRSCLCPYIFKRQKGVRERRTNGKDTTQGFLGKKKACDISFHFNANVVSVCMLGLVSNKTNFQWSFRFWCFVLWMLI